jgi:hypothetical protein
MVYNYRDDPILGPALAYWTRKRGSRAMPGRRDIDPTEIPPRILPNLQLIDVLNGGARFRYRLVGTALVDAYGRDFTGAYPDELFPDDRLKFIQGIYQTVCRSKAPLFTHNKYHTPKNVDLLALRVYLPLSDDDTEVHHILGTLRFEYDLGLGCGSWGDGAKIDPSAQYIETIDIAHPAAEAAV